MTTLQEKQEAFRRELEERRTRAATELEEKRKQAKVNLDVKKEEYKIELQLKRDAADLIIDLDAFNTFIDEMRIDEGDIESMSIACVFSKPMKL